MSEVYVLDSDTERYAVLMPKGDQERLQLNSLIGGQPAGADWRPPRVDVLPAETPRQGQAYLGDCPAAFFDAPVFSQRACDVLMDIFASGIELLPLGPDAIGYFACNVMTYIPGLREEDSGFELYPDGKTFLITRHAFREELLSGITMFRMPYKHRSSVYVTSMFVERVRMAQLEGFVFHRVYGAAGPVDLRVGY